MTMSKMHQHHFSILFVLCFFIPLQALKAQLPEIPIKYGTAIFKGCICNWADWKDHVDERSTFTLIVSDPLTSHKEYTVVTDSLGDFHVEIPVFGLMHGYIKSEFYTGYLYLLPNQETNLVVYLTDDGPYRVNLSPHLGVSVEDLMHMPEVLDEILNDDQVDSITYISARAKEILKLSLSTISISDFLSQHKTKNSNLIYSNYLHAFFQKILNDPSLHIPPIDSMSITQWVENVEEKLALRMHSMESDSMGLFMDLLLANAFMSQLESLIPLSSDQKKDIEQYFENSSYTDYLFEANDHIN